MKYIGNFLSSCLSAVLLPFAILLLATFFILLVALFAILLAILCLLSAIGYGLRGKSFKEELEKKLENEK